MIYPALAVLTTLGVGVGYNKFNGKTTKLPTFGLLMAVTYGCIAATKGNGLSANNAMKCAYVPGAGFSGFPFTLGRLHSMGDPTKIECYCYSAGCLAATVALSGMDTQTAQDPDDFHQYPFWIKQ